MARPYVEAAPALTDHRDAWTRGGGLDAGEGAENTDEA